MQADHLGRIRTGAASGIATKYLARPDASRVAMIGTGRQARTQLQAIARVRNLTGVKAFGRDRTACKAFCREMSEGLGVPVEPASSAEEATRFGEIVCTATTAQQPVVRGECLQPGAHVNAIGANMANRRELDDEAIRRATLIAVDSVEQSRKESGDLIQGLANLGRGWESVIELHSVVAGKHPGRSSPRIKSHSSNHTESPCGTWPSPALSTSRRCSKEKEENWKLIRHGMSLVDCFSDPSPSIAIFLAVISPLSARSPATDIVSPVCRSCPATRAAVLLSDFRFVVVKHMEDHVFTAAYR